MKTQCPKCSAVYNVATEASAIGKAVRCKKCGEIFRIRSISTHTSKEAKQSLREEDSVQRFLADLEAEHRRSSRSEASGRRPRFSNSQRRLLGPGKTHSVLKRRWLMWLCAVTGATTAVIGVFLLVRNQDEQANHTPDQIVAKRSAPDALESGSPAQGEKEQWITRDVQNGTIKEEPAADSAPVDSQSVRTFSPEAEAPKESEPETLQSALDDLAANSQTITPPVDTVNPPTEKDQRPPPRVSEPPSEPERHQVEQPAAFAVGGPISPQVLQRLKDATVFVTVSVGSLATTASGFLVEKEGNIGYVVTSAHVLSLPGRRLGRINCVFHSGTKAEQSVNATVVGLDEDHDLAILKFELDTLPEPVGLEAEAAVGETLPVFVLGFPFGDDLRTSERHPAVTISRASISSVRRDDHDRVAVIQIDGDINPGNSGGPIVDAQGRLIGITAAKVLGTQIGIAIPAEELSQMLEGRVAGARIEVRRVKNGVAEVAAEVRLIDPMQKIKSVSIHYIREAAVKGPLKANQDGLWPRLPKAREVELRGDGQWAVGEFKIRSRGRGTSDVAFQIAYVGGEGKTVYMEPGRFTVDFGGVRSASGVAGRREEPTVGPTPWAKPNGANDRKPVVEFSWRAPRINVITPPAETAVAGRIERDSRGRRYTALTAKAVTLDLGKDLLQVVACPTGKVAYAIQRGEPVVRVLDPVTWTTIDEIVVPRSPTSIWADATLIGIACDKSRVVALIDAQKRSLIASARLPELPGYIPDTVIGRAPDGAVMSLWQKDGGSNRDRALVHVGRDGKAKLMINGEAGCWATWLPDGTGVIAQGDFSGRPCGSFDLSFPDGPRGFSELHNNRLFGPGGFNTDTVPAFFTSDYQALVFSRTRVNPGDWQKSTGYRPAESVDDRRANGARVPWTYLISPSLDRVLSGFPGNAIAELPNQRLFITVGTIGNTQPVCYYISRTDGRVVREITLEWPQTGQALRLLRSYWNRWGPHSRPVFIPGHELLLIPNWNWRGSIVPADRQLTYAAFRCGPVQVPTSTAPINDPPSSAAPGEEIRYAPVFEPGITASAFRLKRTLPGMTIDPRSGELAWQPGREHVGRWLITILATVEGEEVTVLTWTLEVR